jgi:GNAT superfamily N-acetyltransferase
VRLWIESYDHQYLQGMVDLYNAETAGEAHIAPLDPERFLNLVESKPYFDPAGLLIAREGASVVGWVHACVAAGSESHHHPELRVPQIRMLIYPRDRLRVGAALVAEATAWLRRSGQQQFLAMHAQHGYPFYRGLWLGAEPMCPATLPHLQLAFEVGGYRNTQESIFMVAELAARPQEAPPNTLLELADAPAKMRHEPMRHSWAGFEPMTTSASADGEEVGSMGWVLLPQVAERLGAPAVNIWSLGVREQHRRKGIATALVSHALARAYDMGARHASVGTQLWNAAAHATYAKLGFRPHCMLVGRTLDLAAT